MAIQTLGDAIRNLRGDLDFSLRELAKKAGISPPFLSDIEAGKRSPSDETLQSLAKTLKVTFEQLKKYDHRESATELRRLIANNPRLGLAFRSTVEDLKTGKITPEQLERILSQQKKGSR
jgi:transcriptional regulator with XRE-family HTH domain